MNKEEINQVYDILGQIEEIKRLLRDLLPNHKFRRVYDKLPGVVGYRCVCGLWDGEWLGDKCDQTEVPLSPGLSYEPNRRPEPTDETEVNDGD